jgi:hypothetical protein
MISLSMINEDKKHELHYTWCAVLYTQLESFMLQTIFGSYSGALLLRFFSGCWNCVDV